MFMKPIVHCLVVITALWNTCGCACIFVAITLMNIGKLTRQSVTCNARRHPVVEHQDTCTCNIIIIAI